MATLVSPGVSVTVTDQSYFIPASAPTVPLIILATRENKPQDPTNTSSPIAAGTQEYGVVRTITSLSQSETTFGIPYFQTTNGQPNHGDARNEYGLATLNRFLGEGNYAYTIRANVNLNDNFTDIQALWVNDIDVATSVLETLVSQWITQYNQNNQLSPTDPSTAGYQTVDYSGTLSSTTAITGAILSLGTLTGGTGYTYGTYTNVPLTGGHGSGAQATVAVASGVLTVSITTQPAGTLVDGTYTGVPLTTNTGSGSGAVATVTISGGIITAVTITTDGTGYAVGDVLEIPYTDASMSGSGATTNGVVTVATIDTAVTSVTITSAGYGYSVGDTLSAAASSIGGTGTGFSVAVATVSSLTSAPYNATVTIDSRAIPVSVNLSTVGSVGSFITTLNSALGTNGVATLSSGNIVITSSTVGTSSTVSVADTQTSGTIATLGTVTGGSGYTYGTYTDVPLSGGTGTGAVATITVGNVGPILTLGAVTGGTNYSNGTYTNVALTGGTGTGAVATLVITNGSVASVSVTSPGTGYTIGDTLTGVPTTEGPIATLGTITPGSGYVDNTYTGVPLTGGTGTGAIATITVSGGAVTTVTLTTDGTGYSVGDSLTASNTYLGGAGTGFAVAVATVTLGSGFSVPVATVNAGVSTVTITNAGSGYVDGDTLSAAASNIGGTGSGFSVPVATVATIAGLFESISSNFAAFDTAVAGTSGYRVTIDHTSLYALIQQATSSIWQEYSFSIPTTPTTLQQDFMSTQGVTGAISTLGTVTGGSNYTNGTYYNVALTGGSGTGAQATITVVGNVVTSVTITALGANYIVGDVLSVAASSIGGTGSGFSVTVTAVTSTSPIPVYANGFTSASTGTFLGIEGLLSQWYDQNEGGTVAGEFTATEAGNLLTEAGDQFEWTNNFLYKTALGTDDASRRAAIVQALTAIVNSNEDIRAETYQYNLLLCPGYPELASAMQALAINYLKSEVLVIGDTPMNVDPSVGLPNWAGSTQRVVDVAGNVCYYYPHVLTTNLDGSTILLPSSSQALTTMAYSDSVSFEWFAPAGLKRGKISGITDLGYCTGTMGTATTFVSLHPNQGQRDALYGYTVTGGINPLAFFPGDGFVVWGQKTSTGTTATDLDRVNVSRLVKYIARQLRIRTMSFVFEPNDALTRNNLKSMVDSFLGTLVTKRGLYDFATICDSSNNTPSVIDQNQLIIDVALQPEKAAEFIYVPITIVATGTSLTTAGAAPSVA